MRGLLAIMAACGLAGCTGSLDGPKGAPLASSGGSGGGPQVSTPTDWQPVQACEPVVPVRVSRLADRQLSNAVRDVLALTQAPHLKTSSSSIEQFLPNKPAIVNGSVAVQLRTLVEELSAGVAAPGNQLSACAGDQAACARAAINSIGSKAFRRALLPVEQTELKAVYDNGYRNYGGHAGGVRLVAEAILQAPSFLYLTELGSGAGQTTLTQPELAAKLAFFLRDGLPDRELSEAAASNQLATDQQVLAHVDRLLATDEVRQNVTKILVRLFDLERLLLTNKAASVTAFTPELVDSMYEETRRFIEATLWQRDASLKTLFTSRESFADQRLAAIYGLPAMVGGFVPVKLPPAQRAGILTQPSVMTMEALPDESSVIHRGVFVVRELLCFHPPPPNADLLMIGEDLKRREPTERGRAERRAEMPVCAGCHANFDPFGIAFEHYDTLGRYRTSIPTAQGDVPVNSTWTYQLYDMTGEVQDAVALSERLAESAAVRECVTRQFASYALGARLTDAQACTVGALSQEFGESGGDLLELVRKVATWPGLRQRSPAVMP